MTSTPRSDDKMTDAKLADGSGNERIIAAHELDRNDYEHQATGAIATDAVFGNISSDGPNYRNVGWIGTAVLMVKTQVGLGVLGIPYVLATLGIVPGVICLLAVGIITTWSDYVVGQFKLRHPSVYSVDDVGELLFGRIGREIFAFAYCMFMLAVVGSGLLGISIALNAVSTHAACTAVFVAVAALLGFSLASIPTLGKVTFLGWVGVISILGALFTLTIAVGVQDRPAAAPAGDWLATKETFIVNKPSFEAGISAISTLVFAYAGTPAFFGIVAEMRDQRLYTRSMLLCQGIVTVTYIVIGVVVYYFCGQYVASPALGSAGVLMKKVCYGLAIPGLAVTVCIYTHLPAKYIFVRFLRNSRHLSSNTWQHWAVWLGCTAGCTLFSYVLASAVPVFGGLVGLVGALFGTLLSMQIMGMMWLYDNWGRRHTDNSTAFRLLVAWNVFIILMGSFIMVAGTYGSVVDIMAGYKAKGGTKPWSCADNSNST